MLTMGEDPEGVALAVAAGAKGYVAKDATADEVAATLSLAMTTPRDRVSGGGTTAVSFKVKID